MDNAYNHIAYHLRFILWSNKAPSRRRKAARLDFNVTSNNMNVKYLALFLMFFTSNAYSYDAFDTCKNNILSSKPYGINAVIEKPKSIKESFKETILDWNGTGKLIISTENGERTLSIGRCIYDKGSSKITFLSIYTKVLISKYPNEAENLKTAQREQAYLIAKKLGLTKEEIKWIKRNGNKSLYGFYNPTNVIGFVQLNKQSLEKLDKLQIINLYPNNNDKNQYLSVKTDISSLLSKKL